MALPFVPGGITKVGQAANIASDVKRFTPDQSALVDLAKEAKRTDVNPEDAETLVKWADEYGLPYHDIQSHPSREYGKFPHINIGPVEHILIK